MYRAYASRDMGADERMTGMARISGPVAILAGVFLALPGLFALIQTQFTNTPMPGWVARDLVIAALCGLALMVWGGRAVRQRELALYDLDEARRWMRVND
jgi:protein-S-isoprenylcysteine O-methyltransferase Ste14